jgi:hypothetical protein
MELTEPMERVYRDCKAYGLKAVARQLGVDCERLLDQLHRAGVRHSEGCPSQREIAERCRDVRQGGRTGLMAEQGQARAKGVSDGR